jgi:thiol-disulfide isomerase/thioredoxin
MCLKPKMVQAAICLSVLAASLGLFDFPAKAGIIVTEISLVRLGELMQCKTSKCLIVYMAAWCAPCRKELPTLVKLNKKYQARGLKLIGVSVDYDGPRAMQPLADQYKLNFPVYAAGDQAVGKFNLSAIPALFLIDNGDIIEKILGQITEKNLEKKIKALLKN